MIEIGSEAELICFKTAAVKKKESPTQDFPLFYTYVSC